MSDVHTYLGSALHDKGRDDEAIVHLQLTYQSNPDQFAARDMLYDCRYGVAIRTAASASEGQKPLAEQERVRLRKNALNNLRECFEFRSKRLQEGKSVARRRTLSDWRTEPALASVRDPAALAKLPEPERAQWQRLWTAVSSQVAAEPLEAGIANAGRRKWREAAECYARLFKGGATSSNYIWIEYAALLLLSGDRDAYENMRARLTGRDGRAPQMRSYHLARICTLAPGNLADMSQASRQAESELTTYTRQFGH